ncbi:hypothetical protein BGW41_001234 [Actinomortierella wolfii]|nr:hypothetical protein BGW41_001234 [Actinomortierella wolfii]
MSDDDDFMMEEEDEDYDFDYEDEDGEEPDVDLENKYYNAKGHKEDDPEVAMEEFQGVVDAETEKGDWGFKALKQMVKLSYKMGNFDKTLEYYEQLLPYTKSAVTRNYSEKSINNILDYISSSADMAFMEKFYKTTLDALKDANNERLLVKTNLKLAKLWLDRKEYSRLSKILRQLHASCQSDDGTDDQRKGTHLLEIFALEIQMYTATKNSKKLKALYQQCLHVKSAIPHPRIMGVIRECGGKMHMSEKEWEKAQADFSESFRNYDEAGSAQRIQVLKYLVLANMLTESQINPFDSPETKPYKKDPQIVAMTNLVSAYQRRDIREFEKILRENRATIMDDLFIRDYIDDVLKNIRTQVLIRLIKPYTTIKLQFISEQLNIPAQDVEDLLVGLILDKKVAGYIDQVNQRLDLERQTSGTMRYNAMEKWAANLEVMYNANLNRVNAMVAKAKAEAQARKLAIEQARAAALAAGAAGGSAATTPAPAAAVGVSAGGVRPATPAVSAATLEEIRKRKEALAAKLQNLSSVPRPADAQTTEQDNRARGGLSIDVSSTISRDEHGNLIINTAAGKLKPGFATTKVNQKQLEQKQLEEKKKKLEALMKPEDEAAAGGAADQIDNPYFDPNLGPAGPKDRSYRPLKFAPKGKYRDLAIKIRAEQRIEQLRKEIEEKGHAKVDEEDLKLKDGFVKRILPQDGIEWWDAPYLPNKSYQDVENGQAKIETEDSLVTIFVQHPVPIEPPNELTHREAAKPRPLMLTTKERKKLRRQRRAEIQKDKQDKIRLGLLPPDPPKVKLSNMMRVLGEEAVLNPTQIEMRVRQETQARLEAHLSANEARKLSPEERKAKEKAKREADVSKGIFCDVYRINDLSHPKKKFKVDTNAQQLGLTGMVILHPVMNVVIVEGGQKAIRQYKKLMLRRIDWTDNTRLDGTEATESTIENKCLLVWEGQVKERKFTDFRFRKCANDAQLKDTLNKSGAASLWELALSFKEGDMAGTEITL